MNRERRFGRFRAGSGHGDPIGNRFGRELPGQKRHARTGDVAFRLELEWMLIDIGELACPDCSGKYALAPERSGIRPENRSGERSRE
jgi:hypothetical protein